MKKIISIILAGALFFSLSGCGVSQEDYDTLLEDNKSLQSQVSSLTSKYDSLVQSSDTVYQNDTFNLSYNDNLLTLTEVPDTDGASDMILLLPADSAANFNDSDFLFTNSLLYTSTYQVDDEPLASLLSGSEIFLKPFAGGVFGTDFDSVYATTGYPYNSNVIFYADKGDEIYQIKILGNSDKGMSIVAMHLKNDVPEEQLQALTEVFSNIK